MTSSTIGHIIVRHVTYPINFRQYTNSWKTPVYLPLLFRFPYHFIEYPEMQIANGAAQYANVTIVVSDNICLTER